jgi:hypothetical protein
MGEMTAGNMPSEERGAGWIRIRFPRQARKSEETGANRKNLRWTE